MPIIDEEIDAAFPVNVPTEPSGSGNPPAHLKNYLIRKLRDEAVIAASGLTVEQANAIASVIAGTAPGVDATARAGLAAKADAVHTHAISSVAGLQAALDAKAALSSAIHVGATPPPSPATNQLWYDTSTE